MKNFSKNVALATMFGCAVFSFQSLANEPLDALEASVEYQAQKMDEAFGVLLTWQERQDLRVKLIVTTVVKDYPALSVADKTAKAITLYEVTDPTEQRQVLIEMQMSGGSGNGGGDDPAKP